MLQKKFLFLLLTIILKMNGCEENTVFICGVKACMYRTGSNEKLYKHRFTHTKQRPLQCSNCGYMGYEQHVRQHIQSICKTASINETVLGDDTKYILQRIPFYEIEIREPQELQTKELLFYRCALRRCSSKSRFLVKIMKHRLRKHIKQKKYTCTLCGQQRNKKKGIPHILKCSTKYSTRGQLQRNQRNLTTLGLLKQRPFAYYNDGTSKRVDNWHIDEATSIECLSDSDDQNKTENTHTPLEDLLRWIATPSDESIQGSSS